MPSDNNVFPFFKNRNLSDVELPLLEADSVSFAPDGKTIIDDVSLSIEAGSSTALVGVSGCGKSTILKVLAGLIVPNLGKVLYHGTDIFTCGTQFNAQFRKETGFVFQDSALWANQTLWQNLELPLKLHFPEKSSFQIKKRIQTVIDQVGYTKSLDIRPVDLSQGEKKLISFARAILCSPKLLFLDEWTESLDDNTSRRLEALVLDLKNAGITLVFVTHSLRVLQLLGEDVCLVKNGKIVDIQSSAEFFASCGDNLDIIDMGDIDEI